MPVSCCSDYYNFVVCLKSGSIMPPVLFFLFKLFDYFLCFHIDLWIFFLVLWRMPLVFDRIALNLQIILGSMYIQAVLIPPWVHAHKSFHFFVAKTNKWTNKTPKTYRFLCMLGRRSTIEIHSQPCVSPPFLLCVCVLFSFFHQYFIISIGEVFDLFS
jgi:hypothetical protein